MAKTANFLPAGSADLASDSNAAAPVLSVIIVNWNSKDYVRQCLTSLYQHCRSVPFEVIVVDGASFDGCDVMLANEFPAVRFFQSPENVGFARANNLGARHARGEYLLLLNPDTLLIEDSIDILIKAHRTLPNAGIVGCRLLNRDRSVQMTSILRYPTILNRTFGSAYLQRKFPAWWGLTPLISNAPNPSTVEAVSGACMLIQHRHFETVGGFTEAYFMFGEDVDLCYKISKAGMAVFFVPWTEIVHFGGGSTDREVNTFSAVTMRDSWFRFFCMHRGPYVALAFKIITTLNCTSRLLILAVLLPLGSRPRSYRTQAIRKWSAILCWSVGLRPV